MISHWFLLSDHSAKRFPAERAFIKDNMCKTIFPSNTIVYDAPHDRSKQTKLREIIGYPVS